MQALINVKTNADQNEIELDLETEEITTDVVELQGIKQEKDMNIASFTEYEDLRTESTDIYNLITSSIGILATIDP